MNVLLLIFGWLSVLIMFFMAIVGVAKARKLSAWLPTTGCISFAALREVTGALPSSGTFRYAAISYTYEVNGRKYIGNRIRHSKSVSAQADDDIERFSVGTTGTVYFDPRNPSVSVLERHTSSRAWACFFLAGFVLIWASYFVFFSLLVKMMGGS
jgi:Protein of unknown function (DUF3592)